MIIALLFSLVCGEGEEDEFDTLNPTDADCWRAVGLSFAAGLSTLLGAFVALFIAAEDVQRGQSKFLAGSLSFAAAVMVYVSLIGVWRESEEQFTYVTDDELVLHVYTSLSFFGGVAMGFLFEFGVNFYQGSRPGVKSSMENTVEMQSASGNASKDGAQVKAQFMELTSDDARKEKNMRTAIVAALSIIAHNFPEGLVLFLVALVDQNVGIATAFAIALHNIPEGVSIAVPYYFGSGSYMKAFGVSLFSGLSEPLGAFIGWAIVNKMWGRDAFGILFGLTAGIMTYVAFAQLFPLARKNDPEDKVVTICCFLGMLVIDLSMWIEK